MEKKYLLLVALFLCITLNAQTPQRFSYQAVVRDAQENIIANKFIGVHVSILQNQTVVYRETHLIPTNANGLLSLEIGGGLVQFGTFATIDWSNGKHFVKTEIDLNGGTNYTLSSTTELLSVPYALHAQTAQRLIENPQETDPIFSASVAKNITQTDIDNWNEKLSNVDTIFVVNVDSIFVVNVDTIFIVNVDSIFVFNTDTVVIVNHDTITIALTDTALLNILINEIEALKKAIEELRIANGIANGTLVKDIDGNVYRTVKIGNQVWMAENLRVTRFNNGDTIMNIRENRIWDSLRNNMPPAYCYYNNDPELQKVYGNLYNSYVINGKNAGRNVCPQGWRIPSVSQWNSMINYLVSHGYNFNGLDRVPSPTCQGCYYVNGLGKALSTPELWHTSYTYEDGAVGRPGYPEKVNATGFSALPAGMRVWSGVFERLTMRTLFHTASSPSIYFNIETSKVSIYSCTIYSSAGLSIRCIKD